MPPKVLRLHTIPNLEWTKETKGSLHTSRQFWYVWVKRDGFNYLNCSILYFARLAFWKAAATAGIAMAEPSTSVPRMRLDRVQAPLANWCHWCYDNQGAMVCLAGSAQLSRQKPHLFSLELMLSDLWAILVLLYIATSRFLYKEALACLVSWQCTMPLNVCL